MKSLHCLILLGLVIGFSGCGGGVDTNAMFAEANATNIQRAASLYSAFQAEHGWVGPASEQELLEYAKKLPADKLQLIGIEGDVESVFVGRDGNPFKFRFDLKSNPRDPPVAIVFENSPTEGKYQVAFTGFKLEEVDQAEYDRLMNQEPATNEDRNRRG